jgi:excisionase family DNA binding protein
MYLEEEVKNLKKEVSNLKEITENLTAEIKATKAVKTLTVEEAANLLGLTKQGVLYHIRRGNLKATGKRYKKIAEEEVINFKNK